MEILFYTCFLKRVKQGLESVTSFFCSTICMIKHAVWNFALATCCVFSLLAAQLEANLMRQRAAVLQLIKHM